MKLFNCAVVLVIKICVVNTQISPSSLSQNPWLSGIKIDSNIPLSENPPSSRSQNPWLNGIKIVTNAILSENQQSSGSQNPWLNGIGTGSNTFLPENQPSSRSENPWLNGIGIGSPPFISNNKNVFTNNNKPTYSEKNPWLQYHRNPSKESKYPTISPIYRQGPAEYSQTNPWFNVIRNPSWKDNSPNNVPVDFLKPLEHQTVISPYFRSWLNNTTKQFIPNHANNDYSNEFSSETNYDYPGDEYTFNFSNENNYNYPGDEYINNFSRENNNNNPQNVPVTEETRFAPNDAFNPQLHQNFKLLPSSKGDCGVQGLFDKIFGGHETSMEEFPWMAILEYSFNGISVGYKCGGMLIADRYVLTAAHCVVGKIASAIGSLYRVRLGEYDLRTDIDCSKDGEHDICNEKPQDIEVVEIIVHAEYNDSSKNKENDIALIRMKNSFKRNDFVRSICLPLNQETTKPGVNMTIAGWGFTESNYTSPVLLKAVIPYVADDQCSNIWRKIIPINNKQFCAGGLKGIGTCHGDSEGPIMATFPRSSTMYAEGIVSLGLKNGCGNEQYPNVYTRVSKYIVWILDNIRS